jgi:hypothetical protein
LGFEIEIFAISAAETEISRPGDIFVQYLGVIRWLFSNADFTYYRFISAGEKTLKSGPRCFQSKVSGKNKIKEGQETPLFAVFLGFLSYRRCQSPTSAAVPRLLRTQTHLVR